MPQKLDYDRVALILVEAVFFGDARAAQRWGVSTKTVQRYRNELNTNEQLSDCFSIKKQEFELNWATEIPAAVRAGIRFLLEAPQKLVTTPESVHAVAGAVKILSEIGLAKEIVDARLAGYRRENGTQGSKVATALPASTGQTTESD